MLTVDVQHTSVHAMPFLVLMCNAQSRSIWIETTSGSGVGLIWIGQLRIQCGRTQTRFDPVQCALDVQCGQALKRTTKAEQVLFLS